MLASIKVNIQKDLCIACGKCQDDCPSKVIEVIDGKASLISESCIKCGHCQAVCPTNAIDLEGTEDSSMATGTNDFLKAEDLLRHLKLRRSIRHYKDMPVEREKIEQILEAGRLTPTASNRQNVRYIIVEKGLNELEDLVLEDYKNIDPNQMRYRFEASRFKRGFLFHQAPHIILIISEQDLDGGLAAMNMELMAEALGLGTLYVGLFARPANANEELKALLGIAKHEKIATCLAIGYPDITYERSAPKLAVKSTYLDFRDL